MLWHRDAVILGFCGVGEINLRLKTSNVFHRYPNPVTHGWSLAEIRHQEALTHTYVTCQPRLPEVPSFFSFIE